MRKTVLFLLTVVILLTGCEALTLGTASRLNDIPVGTKKENVSGQRKILDPFSSQLIEREELREHIGKPPALQAPRSEPAVEQGKRGRAKTPSELFETVAPSVVVVVASDASGEAKTLGSGVVVARGQVITNCHVLAEGVSIEVRQDGRRVPATLTHADPDRDLCRLGASGLTAPSVRMGTVKDLKVGARVYAVGAPQGLELTLTDGLVSGLRDIGGGTVIQTTAPISQGSSGGGLFDEEGRLVGITTFYLAESQSLNFALPADWIAALPRWEKDSGHDLAGDPWLLKAVELENKQDWPAMVQHAQRWTKARPSDGAAWFSLGVAYWQSGQTGQAIDAYRQGLSINPEYAGVWYNLGFVYWKSGQTGQAIDAYLQALRIDPEYADAWNNLGVVYGQSGQTSQAIEAFRQALRIDPEKGKAWFGLGEVYRKSGQTSQAIEAFRQGLRIDPENAWAWAGLGIAYRLEGRTSQVMEVYRRLKVLDPKLAEWFFNEVVLP